MAKDAKGHGSESRGGGMVVTKSRYSQYPGYRTMTGSQRTNARHDAIWERARAQGHATFNASADAAAASKLAAPGNPKSVAAPVHPDASGPRYNREAVNQAIASSNRAGRRIGGREATAIHALLKGRH